jgi:hypothetical protein
MEYRIIHGEEVLVTTYKPRVGAGNEAGLDNWTAGLVNITVQPSTRDDLFGFNMRRGRITGEF